MINYSRPTIIFFLILMVLAVGCHSIKSTKSNTRNIEDFDSFYERFHKDSLFQKSRLKFPLQGHDALSKQWTKSNWVVMKGRIYDVDRSQYKVVYKKTDNSFFQKVWIDGAGFSSECRFELIGRKWYLVYALEQND